MFEGVTDMTDMTEQTPKEAPVRLRLRQAAYARLVAEGLSDKEIGLRLGIRTPVVSNTIREISAACGLPDANRARLAAALQERGIEEILSPAESRRRAEDTDRAGGSVGSAGSVGTDKSKPRQWRGEGATSATLVQPQPPVASPAPISGWARPVRSSYFHYYEAGQSVSVCGEWFYSRLDVAITSDCPRNASTCSACRRKLGRRG